MKNFFATVLGKLKEAVRRFFVFLKKKPDIIPIVALTVSFLLYSLNLTSVSNTTAKIYGAHMGLCSFVSMLFMILSFVCILGAYPRTIDLFICFFGRGYLFFYYF